MRMSSLGESQNAKAPQSYTHLIAEKNTSLGDQIICLRNCLVIKLVLNITGLRVTLIADPSIYYLPPAL
jgi:hypothetical protein